MKCRWFLSTKSSRWSLVHFIGAAVALVFAEDGVVIDCLPDGCTKMPVACSFMVNRNLLHVVFLVMGSAINLPFGCLMAKLGEGDLSKLICSDSR